MMKSHELAKLLLEMPDLPVATHAHNHTYNSETQKISHGPLRVVLVEDYSGPHLVIGDYRRDIDIAERQSQMSSRAIDEWRLGFGLSD